MKGSNTTGGFCYTFGYGSPYAGGVVKNTTNGGSSWATSTGESAKFSTFEPVVVVSMPISASPVLH
jgi:hypothetical protein